MSIKIPIFTIVKLMIKKIEVYVKDIKNNEEVGI